MTSPCRLCDPLFIFWFFVWPVSYQRKVGDYFFPERLVFCVRFSSVPPGKCRDDTRNQARTASVAALCSAAAAGGGRHVDERTWDTGS
jgi:hypothetical protein